LHDGETRARGAERPLRVEPLAELTEASDRRDLDRGQRGASGVFTADGVEKSICVVDTTRGEPQ
jgi:hypothetical protein